MDYRPLRIAMIHRDLPCDYNRGGVSYHVHRFANQLVKRGHEVTIFSADPKPQDARYRVHQVPVPGKVKNSKIFQLYFWPVYVARQDYSGFDLLHAHGDSQFLRSNGTPVVRTFYGSALGEAISATGLRRKVSQLSLFPFEILSGKLATRSIAISRTTTSHLPFAQTIIPCGVDLEQFRPAKEKSPCPSILFVGMLAGRKRGKLLIEAFKNQVQPTIPQAELWMVCPDRIETEGVTFFGKVPPEKLIELYRKAWVFCLPSSYEGFGIPFIEALASGTPVVTTPSAGAREVLEEGTYGIICSENKLGQTLVEVIRDEELKYRLIEQGLEHVKQFSWDNIVGSYENIYNSLVSKDRTIQEC